MNYKNYYGFYYPDEYGRGEGRGVIYDGRDPRRRTPLIVYDKKVTRATWRYNLKWFNEIAHADKARD